MEHKLFKSKFQLWDYLKHKVEGVDINTTLRMPMFWFVLEDGEVVKVHGCTNFAKEMNKRFNLGIDPKLSYRSRKACVLFFNDKEVTPTEEVVEPVVEPVECVSEDVTDPSVEEAVEKETTQEVDWEWINCLSSSRDDKLRLDNYASDKFGIELKRNKSLENMIKDFKEALAK